MTNAAETPSTHLSAEPGQARERTRFPGPDEAQVRPPEQASGHAQAAHDPVPAQVIVVMGVSGSGKTTVGALLAGLLGREYADADDFHSSAGIAKMRAGHALDDADRRPWLERIAAWMDAHIAAGEAAVVTCSALKRAYRDVLRRPEARLVFLEGDRDLIARRLSARQGHFFPAGMLDGQLRDLEPPEPDEDALCVPIDGTPAEIAQRIVAELS